MALGFKLAELFVDIKGDDRHLNRTLSGVHRALGVLDSRMVRVGAGLASGGAMAGGAALTALLVSSTRAAVDAEQAMVRLAKAADLDDAGVARMRDELRALALELKAIPFGDLVDIAVAGSKLGIANDDLIEYTSGIAKLSTALDDIPAGEIADQVGKINAVFKLGVKGAEQVGSAVDKLADSGAAAASDILRVTQRISGTAQQARLSAPDTIALAAALLETGTMAELASGTLNRLIIGLDMAGKLGDDSAEGIRAFLGELAALNTAGRQARLEDIGIGGKEDLAEINKLVTQIEKFRVAGSDAANEFETLNQQTMSYAMTAKTTASRVTDLQNQFLFFRQDLGTKMVPVLEETLVLAREINDSFKEAFDAGAVDTFTASLKEAASTARGLNGLFGKGGDQAKANLGKSVLSTLLEVGKYVNPLTSGMASRAQEDLQQQMIDQAFAAMDRGAAARPIPAKPGGFLPAWHPDFAPSPVEGFASKRPGGTPGAPSEAAGTMNLISSMIAAATHVAGEPKDLTWEMLGPIEAALYRDQAKASAAQEFAARKEEERRDAMGIGQTTSLAGFARELQEKALGKDGVAERQLKAQEDIRELERLQEKHLGEVLQQLKNPPMRAGVAS